MSRLHIPLESLLTHDIDFYASKVNNLEKRSIKGEQKLFRNEILVPSITFCEALTKLQR
jgi:predicted nucleotidyltransferase